MKCVLPPVRAMMAKRLMAKHDLNQQQAAKLLGVSQPAISLYNRRMRGNAIDLEKDAEIAKLVENLATSLVESKMAHKEFIPRFCDICRTIRAKGLLCQMHRTLDPTINVEECELCMSTNSVRCP